MVRRAYSHLGQVRHRADVVEYRVEQHFEELGEQVRRLGLTQRTSQPRSRGGKRTNPATTEVNAGLWIPMDGPGRIRTGGLLLRRQALYPTELRTRPRSTALRHKHFRPVGC
jgi:hypothetical protein